MTTVIPLGQVVDVSAGQPAPKPDEFSNSGEPFIRAGSLERLISGTGEENCERISEETARQKRLRLYPENTILFAKSGMSAKLGRVYRLKRPAYVVSHLAALTPIGKYDPNYLSYWLRKNPPSHLIKDDAYPSIRTSEIANLEVPNISLDEQRRIAAILDKADAIRRKRQQAIALADKFLESAFLDMFGDPETNPRELPQEALGELLERIDSGHSPKCEARPAADNEVGILKVSSISSTHFRPEENKAVFETYPIDERNLINRGDLLFSRKNTYQLVGASAIVDTVHGKLALPDLIFRLVPRADRRIEIPYLWMLLTQESIRERLRKVAGGSAASMPNIGKERLRSVLLPIAEPEDQAQFSKFYSKRILLKNKLQENLNVAENLFASLSQRAFRGEL
ncbi:restriction endonuclease subunit S [Paracoccus sp. R12_1]|uniref:restriction endonuclease subunit S n=1 Tax=unclassified Paracoccus (in: a-proteobacteria) TaxID=2688777 RepID=UPI001ADD5038|nr:MULTISPECIES: restriction endonuclease subunit S [unclassified Paracoccus (in: a-proteobacteria)]MBO9455343.1 restriction endonuclease subunit S [Paracoccus sp. R12_2]MBO9485823.1 restriction endonuclease subunit S [Paracoccus sp. R12_1]